jgi:hypothetical protein
MKKMYLAVLFVTAFISTNAQQWEWAFEGKGVINPKVVTLNNYVYLTGTFQHSCSVGSHIFTSAFPEAGFVAKFDGSGTLLWDTEFGASQLSIAGIEAFNSGIYIAGSFQGTLTGYAIGSASNGNSDLFFLRLSQGGNVEMVKTDGSAEFENIVSFDVDSTIIVQGQFSAGAVISGTALTSQCSGTLNVYFAKYSQAGANIWVKEIAGTASESGVAVSIRFDNNKDIIFQGEIGGALDYAGTFMGQCQLCHPLLRFSPAGIFIAFIRDMQSGIGQYELSLEYDLDAHNNIYNLVDSWGSHSNHEIHLGKLTPAGTQIYDRQITANLPGPMGSELGGSSPQQLVVKGSHVFISGEFYGDIYFNGADTVHGGGMFVVRSDTAATYQHAALVSGSHWNPTEMAVDNLDNVYITGTANSQLGFGGTTLNAGNTNNVFFLAKLGSSVTVSLKENKKKESLSVFPNPSDGRFMLKVNHAEPGAMSIYDALGRCVYSRVMPGSTIQIDMDQPDKGIYFIKLETGKRVYQKKILIH